MNTRFKNIILFTIIICMFMMLAAGCSHEEPQDEQMTETTMVVYEEAETKSSENTDETTISTESFETEESEPTESLVETTTPVIVEIDRTEETTEPIEETVEEETQETVTEATEETVVETTEETIEATESATEVATEATEETEETVEDTTEETEDEGSSLVSLGTFKLTAYCNCSICCGVWAGGATASGVMPVANHTIAVDTSVIPFGTQVVINGITYVAEDVGGAINGNRIDIYFDTHQEALNFGVQYAEVFIVKN